MEVNGPTPVTGTIGTTTRSVSGATERPTAVPTTAAEFTPTTDLTRLIEAARQVPEVRQELIGEVARRLSSGELLLPPASDRVVGSLLEGAALGDA